MERRMIGFGMLVVVSESQELGQILRPSPACLQNSPMISSFSVDVDRFPREPKPIRGKQAAIVG